VSVGFTGGARESERRERRRERVGALFVERHRQLPRIEVARRCNMVRPRCNSLFGNVALRGAELTH
jgi:hypothetical protein